MHIRLFVLQQIHLPALQGLSQATCVCYPFLIGWTMIIKQVQPFVLHKYIHLYMLPLALPLKVFFFLLVRLCTCKVILISWICHFCVSLRNIRLSRYWSFEWSPWCVICLFDASISLVFLACSLHDFVCSFIRELVVRWRSS